MPVQHLILKGMKEFCPLFLHDALGIVPLYPLQKIMIIRRSWQQVAADGDGRH
jgi:hypothetical protein